MTPQPAATIIAQTQAQVDVRLKEYEIVLDNTAKLSDRRQTTNDIFVGLNSLVLTALGFLFVASRFTSWWSTSVFVLVAVFTTIINFIWLSLNRRYKNLIGVRIGYLEALEKAIEQYYRFGPLPYSAKIDKQTYTQEIAFGVHQLESKQFGTLKTYGFSKLERNLIATFIITYFALAVIVAGLTILVSQGIIPPLDIKAIAG